MTLFREELFQTLCSQIEGIDSKSVAPASVWLNGGYYNFEWLQEVYDDTYMEENYGLMQKRRLLPESGSPSKQIS